MTPPASARWTSSRPVCSRIEFDPAGRISSLINPEGHDELGIRRGQPRPGDVAGQRDLASNTYDQADQVLLLANLKSSGTTLSSFNYTYNPVGNRTQSRRGQRRRGRHWRTIRRTS